MQDIMRFLEEWWTYFAIIGGAIAFLVIVSAIIGRTGRKAVRPVGKSDPAPTDAIPEKAAEDAAPAIPGEEAAAALTGGDAADSRPTSMAETKVEPTPVHPVPAAETGERATAAVPIDPSTTAADAEPMQSPVPAQPVPDAGPSSDPDAVSTAEPVAESEEKTPAAVRPKAPKPILGAYRVVYRAEDDKWLVRRDGSERILRTLLTQAEAVHWATIRALTQDAELIVHKKDGSVRKTPGK